ncbi:MAG: hypothetical protein ACP5O3_01320 [Candidatus Micrarchaeia archaeon]
MRASAREIASRVGKRYSEELGIDVDSGKAGEAFKWLLASVLFCAPIRESTAAKTYRVFEREGVLTPKKILEVGWEGLVGMLDEGGYTRYDFKTADKLLELAANLQEKWGGDLNALRAASKTREELERNLKALARGVGDLTASLFLREMRAAWGVEPTHSSYEEAGARALGIKSLHCLEERLLKRGWSKAEIIKLETALNEVGRKKRR